MTPLYVIDPVKAFWSKVQQANGDECWEWLGSKDTTGYGRVSRDGVTRPAHRVAYEYLVGPIPGGLYIDHLCLNKGCVNPTHMEPVTHAENIRRGWVQRRGGPTCPQ